MRERPLSPPVQFSVDLPGNETFPRDPVLRVSPNGESILFVAQDAENNSRRLYLYNLAAAITRELPGTEGTQDGFWSFDSRSLLLSRNGSLSRMDIDANSPQPLSFESGYCSWGPDGVVTATREGLQWFRPEVAGARLLLRNDGKAGANFVVPTQMGRWFLYNDFNGTPSSGVSVSVASLDGKEQRKLFSAERAAIYAAPGYALYLRGATLMARRLDPASAQLKGEAVPVIGPVERPLGSVDTGTFSASNAPRRRSASAVRSGDAGYRRAQSMGGDAGRAEIPGGGAGERKSGPQLSRHCELAVAVAEKVVNAASIAGAMQGPRTRRPAALSNRAPERSRR